MTASTTVSPMTVQLYAVGGMVRDEILGVPSKDYDYTAVVPFAKTVDDAWGILRSHLTKEGFEIFLETPQYFTIRARFPESHRLQHMTADFVLARSEGPYTDGRHPDWVKVGSLHDDLARRDFTMNALAKQMNGYLIDLFGGVQDIHDKVIRTVGEPEERFREDYLRALRAIRFAVTKEMNLDLAVVDALRSEEVAEGLASVSVERMREELFKAFRHDTMRTLDLLMHDFYGIAEVVFDKGLWLKPTVGSK